MNHNLTLCDRIAQSITVSPQQRMTFAEYMEWVLYDPQQGYYWAQAVENGIHRDFFTAVHLGADFGELLAEQVIQLWDILDRPTPFTLLEMGSGQGLLAKQMLRYLPKRAPELGHHLEYWIVEKSAPLVAQQQQTLQGLPVRWVSWEDIPSHAIVGCCFANELVDAFPVHQVVIKAGQLQEVYVTNRQGATPDSRFQEIVAEPSTPELAAYFKQVGIDLSRYPDGYRTEVNLAVGEWLKTVADRLQRGYLITIDYGYPASRYYSLSRSSGTLQCYYQHRHHADPYRYIGQQDITAHVDFTALETYGTLYGLQPLGFVEQALFLMALGLGDRIAALSDQAGIETTADIQKRLARRQALHSLIDPFGLGKFGVLIQSKGLETAHICQPLKGLSLP